MGLYRAEHPSYPTHQLVWRSLLASPFVLSLVLAVILVPSSAGNVRSTMMWLAVLSLVFMALMLCATRWLLAMVGLVSSLAFPLLVGSAFGSAPTWAQSFVAVAFYGSWLASAAAGLIGVVDVLWSAECAEA